MNCFNFKKKLQYLQQIVSKRNDFNRQHIASQPNYRYYSSNTEEMRMVCCS
jgi:hypothetical protein